MTSHLITALQRLALGSPYLLLVLAELLAISVLLAQPAISWCEDRNT